MKARLIIDFKSKESMVEWFETLRDPAIDAFPVDSGVFELDALDKAAITPANTYIVKRVGDRPEECRMVLKTVEVSERVI